MFNTPRRIGPALRLALVRRPWIRWLAVTVLSLAVGWMVLAQLRDVEAAQRSWTEQQTVFVAAHDHSPGDPFEVEERRLPLAAVPLSAVTEPPVGLSARQQIGLGEIVTHADVSNRLGPAAGADDGSVVVAISDPLLVDAESNLSVGLEVAVHSEGVVLAQRARIVSINGDVVFIALDARIAPSVSAAAQMRVASIAFLA